MIHSFLPPGGPKKGQSGRSEFFVVVDFFYFVLL